MITADYWPNSQPPSWASQATIYHLLASTSCIASYRHEDSYCFDLDESIDEETFKKKVLRYAAEQPIFYGEVGGTYSHSETNYFILGMIIEYVSKEKLSDFFRKNLFEPLGMQDTFLPSFGKYGQHPNTANKKGKSNCFLAFGDGGVIASVGDIHKWNLALHSMQVLQKESYDQITKLNWGIDTCCQFSEGTLDMLAQLGRKEPYNEWIDVYYGYGKGCFFQYT
ncbi:Beta-lactamase [Cardinium endosymbiont of Sogatella furcifera]|uniref:serine hydrolase domain-containing protein n=1 Tax=Cardinium endosymbiont of Sogatella furcifera TaxID=650378 RepID=UPI000E0CFEF9|nr:serine hydrolase domain-containing protein [Cardinium endosymbiont of Sogatella furcifera]AXI24312.1 Beta-lactamase [Cardinium endosymbiont of Sogatella furcifera]